MTPITIPCTRKAREGRFPFYTSNLASNLNHLILTRPQSLNPDLGFRLPSL